LKGSKRRAEAIRGLRVGEGKEVCTSWRVRCRVLMTLGMAREEHPVVLFDGVCNLCSAAVQFVLARDARARFRFASLQSEAGRALLAAHGAKSASERLESMVLLDRGRIYSKSGALLRIARYLDGGWPLFSFFLIVPRRVRDAVYSFVARHRYRWFGKKEVCWLPTPELSSRFIDAEGAGEAASLPAQSPEDESAR
jgi:predicted DCC family thiol-disulfide oxidoreductase YuxK